MARSHNSNSLGKRSLLALLAAFVLGAALLYSVSLAIFSSEEVDSARGRLSLLRSTLTAEVERFAHLPLVLAEDPLVVSAAKGERRDVLNQRLEVIADRAGLDAIYLMDLSGLTVAASNHALPGSFLGQHYGFRPYFQAALSGVQGSYYAIGATTLRPGYFIADPVRDVNGAIIGVMAIKLDLGELETSWSDGGERVFVANSDNIVLLASDPDLRFRSLSRIPETRQMEIRTARQFADEPLQQLDWKIEGEDRVRLNGETYLHLSRDDLPYGWAMHLLASPQPAQIRAWLSVGIGAVIAAAILVVAQIRGTARMGDALRKSEAEELELREANKRLAVEIEERRTAERRLTRTQNELARAGKLAALGQLAASVTHELGQPIAAMRNHLIAAELAGGAQSEKFMPWMSGLVDRMESITRQLKFFASPGGEEMVDVDLNAVVQAALALVQPNLQQVAPELTVELGSQPVLVRGSQVRLEQVVTNILRNALDAIEDSDRRVLTVSVSQSEGRAMFSVRDSGPGLSGATLAELQEPFLTTRASGQGMGLGLAISAEIVKEHAGTMTAEDCAAGGACFTVYLPSALTQKEQTS